MGRMAMLMVGLMCVVAMAGCGAAGGGSGAGPDRSAPLNVDAAVALSSSDGVSVSGQLLSIGGDVRLCAVLAESYPPSCGGAFLRVEGLDLADVVGLSRTVPGSGVTDAAWTDFPVTLSGRLAEGVLAVDAPPPAAGEARDGSVTVRFDHVPQPVPAAGGVRWLIDVRNTGAEPLPLTFGNGQRGDVILSRDGVEVYRWSADRFFTAAIEEVTLAPGASLAVTLEDEHALDPGTYEARVFVTASGTTLPEVLTTVVVR